MDQWPGFNEAVPYAWTGGAGLLGRLLFHAHQVQRGLRKPLSWVLLLDIPIALAMGWSAYGICVWQEVIPQATISIAIIASYLGPYTVDRIAAVAADKWLGRGKP
jgi:hypothetical protein